MIRTFEVLSIKVGNVDVGRFAGEVEFKAYANGALVEFTPPPVVSHPDPGKLAEYQKARDLLARSVENDRRDLEAADLAARTLAEIDDARSDPAPAPEEIEAKKVKIAEARKEQTRLAGVVKALEADERAAAIAACTIRGVNTPLP